MVKAVDAKDLKKAFGKTQALDGITLSVEKGELFGILGPNGAGKTTMIKILTGQLKPDSGKAIVLGIDSVKEPVDVRRAVGIMPEQENPASFLTSEEYLEFVCKIRGLDDIKSRCDHWLEFLEFEENRGSLCKDLSRGTRQKLMFAQAFIHEPEMVFIDEPLINLDPIIQKKIKDYLTDYVEKGNTVFFSTHVLEIAEEICTSIGIIDRGKIIYQGKMKDLKKKRQKLNDFFLKLVNE